MEKEEEEEAGREPPVWGGGGDGENREKYRGSLEYPFEYD